MRILVVLLLGLAPVALAEPLRVRPPRLVPGTQFTVLELAPPVLPPLAAGFEGATFWDLRPATGVPSIVRRFTVRLPSDVGLGAVADEVGADRALCTEVGSGLDGGCQLFRDAETDAMGPRFRDAAAPGRSGERTMTERANETASASIAVGDAFRETRAVDGGDTVVIEGRATAEGLALVPAGPAQVVLVRETIRSGEATRLRYRFLATNGLTVASFEGAVPRPGAPFVAERGEVLAARSPTLDDGLTIAYEELSRQLRAGAVGFLQRSVFTPTPLSSMHPGWTSVSAMKSIDATSVPDQPDPGDPGSLVTLPEVWDFTGLVPATLSDRTFNTTRNDTGWSSCLQTCAALDSSASPADGTWQTALKIDGYTSGTRVGRDVFLLNDNDTGANPSIDGSFVAQSELDPMERTQICFADSTNGTSPDRFLRFFRFAGPNPASAELGVGDTWTSAGAWTSCNDASGLYITLGSLCGDHCYPECDQIADPRARGLFPGGAGLRTTILEDGFVHVAAGNFVPALLMLQEQDLQGGVNAFGTCNLLPQRQRTFDYFWVQPYYGLLATVSAPNHDTMPADDWSAAGNETDGADFTWGPFPPYRTEADACLAGTRIRWSLPSDGSNLTGEPGVSDYGYVVSWGTSDDPEALADWSTNPNHTPLPGELGYLAAPAGGEPTSHTITGWAGSSIRATVVTALRYTDPDAGDTRAYRSAAFYKVLENPARLDPVTFRVGQSVAPFTSRSGSDLHLSWPAVPGAAAYELRVWNLGTKSPLPCPVGLDCHPAGASVVWPGGAVLPGPDLGFRAFAVDACGGSSAD